MGPRKKQPFVYGGMSEGDLIDRGNDIVLARASDLYRKGCFSYLLILLDYRHIIYIRNQ
jgi:hypothetical protein